MLIDGQLTDLVYDAPLDALLKVSGPTQIVVTVPRGVQADLVLAGPGFGRGEHVSFKDADTLEASANDANQLNDGNDEGDGANTAQKGKRARKRRKAKRGRHKNSRIVKQESLGKGANRSTESQAMRAGVDVEIAVFVPAVENFPVGVDFAPRILRLVNPIRVEGTANTWIRLAARV
jgi:hypothetical protein